MIKNNVNNKVYIGVTSNYEERTRLHLECAYNKNHFLYNHPLYIEARQYGWDKFSFYILDDLIESEAEAYKAEEEAIIKYDSIIDHNKGYNLNYGGLHGKHSEHTKTLMSSKQSGSLNPSFGKKGADAFASKGCINITDGISYGSMRECALAEYGDIKYVKQISRVCDPASNRLTYKGKIYRKIENGVLIEKDTTCIGNGKKRVYDYRYPFIFESMAEYAEEIGMSLGMVRDRLYGRVNDSEFYGILV